MSALIWVILGMVLGGVASLAWRHRRRRDASSVRDDKPADPLLALDTHLVLNVLNRLAIQITDEHLQDGLDALGQYLGANARDVKDGSVPPGELGRSLECYWRLTEWQHQKAAAVWHQEGLWPKDIHQRAAVLGRLQSALQAIERVEADRVELMASESFADGQASKAVCKVNIRSTAHPPSTLPPGWEIVGDGVLQTSIASN